jgi:hypothetical protein
MSLIARYVGQGAEHDLAAIRKTFDDYPIPADDQSADYQRAVTRLERGLLAAKHTPHFPIPPRLVEDGGFLFSPELPFLVGLVGERLEPGWHG